MARRGGRPARDRVNHLQVVVDGDERRRIQEHAAAAGLSVSAYLRAAGLHQTLRCALDYEAVRELVQVAGDQGRLGGLLKLWLAERPGQGANAIEMRRLLDRIGTLQDKLAEVVGRV